MRKTVLKRIFLIVCALIFASGILMTSVYRARTPVVMAELEEPASLEFGISEAEEEATSEAEELADYTLTYPGILPDHFLYPLKMLRDRIWLFLTTDVLKRAELLLKFADKRIWAAQMLLDKGKTELAVSTATKAEKYLERAVNQAKTAQEKGKDVVAFWEKLSRATRKHEEVLLGVREKVGDPARSVIDEAIDYSRQGYEEIMEALGRD